MIGAQSPINVDFFMIMSLHATLINAPAEIAFVGTYATVCTRSPTSCIQ